MMRSVMNVTRFSQLLLALVLLWCGLINSTLASAYAQTQPLCGRSHAEAIRVLSLSRKIYDADIPIVAGDPESADVNDAAALTKNWDYFIQSFGMSGDRKTFYPKMQMGVGNDPGRWKTGLCWWHSRFHRSALYLMEFAPNRAKPDHRQALALMDRIAHFQIATIPGYSSLAEFTADFPDELYSVLSDWELRTTVLAPGYAIGGAFTKAFLSKKQLYSLFAEEAKNISDDLTTLPRPVFLFKEKFLDIHSFLGIGIVAKREEGKENIYLRYVDNELPGRPTEILLFSDGEYREPWNGYGYHAGFGDDFSRIQSALRTRCGANYLIPRK